MIEQGLSALIDGPVGEARGTQHRQTANFSAPMTTPRSRMLPLHELMTVLEGWRQSPSARDVRALGVSLERLAEAYQVSGLHLDSQAEPLRGVAIGVGSLADAGATDQAGLFVRQLRMSDADQPDVRISVDAEVPSAELLAGAIELALASVTAKQEARLRRNQLEALDSAVRSIAGIMPVDTVLQLIVDRVRELVEAEYAALGIVGPFGRIEQFITSGMSHATRATIGALPKGLGLLGLIINEDRSFLIDDLAADPRRHGFPPHHPPMHAFLGTPVRSKGQSVGNFYLTNKLSAPTFSETDLRLVESFALHAGIAIDNARLHEEIGRLAIVEDRERISQDLHDSVIQSLYGISLSLEDLPEVAAEDAMEGAARTDRAIESIHSTIRDIRNFIMGLQPELLADADLSAGIESLAAEFQANTLIDLELHLDPALAEVDDERAVHVLAITREALSNIARHSSATRASISMTAGVGVVRLIIGDNGRGFDTSELRTAGQHGLANLRARAEAAGGSLTLLSEPGAGTRLMAEIPSTGTAEEKQ